MNKIAAIGGLIVLLASCASNFGVVPMGEGKFMLSRQAATGFSGMGTLKADALREAGTFCKSRKEVLDVVNTQESKPPYILANYPRVEIEFRCTQPAERAN